ncbi:methionine ABC transporter ATP-binding protein [Paucilactobacillus wasatchensis]|uniref:methionine ABC transporter ATP-binding protein n=1 Tax=Paucilactobacillus wasatchensis TaxID=1335616 RepID=UPI0005C6FD17|nr:methionine ABC transporter ATP-binding protein [Paucilactobacillus wasatchensis]
MIRFDHVSKEFEKNDKQELQVLKDVNLTINEGSIFGIIGYSGAGKSTLIRCINGIEKPTTGDVYFRDTVINNIPNKQLRERRKEIGMIFQQFNLMPSRTVFENVALPIKYSGLAKDEIKAKVNQLLELVGLPDKLDVYPSTLSGGQKQRVAIARALVNDPQILLCDEATSALDPQTTADILKLLKRLNDELGITIVVVTHEMQVIEDLCEYVAVLDTGKIVEQGDVYSMFADPQQELTRKFISTTSKLNLPDEVLDSDLLHLVDNQLLIKITYVNTEAIEPLISHISRQFEVDANIIVGDIKILQQKPLGGLVIILDGTKANIEATVQYINDQNIRLEVLDHA